MIKKPDPVTGVLLGVIHGAAIDVRRAREQLTMGDVHGKGLLVEGAHASRTPTGLPSSKSTANVWDGWQMAIHCSSVARWSSNTISGWSRLHSELATFDDREDQTYMYQIIEEALKK